MIAQSLAIAAAKPATRGRSPGGDASSILAIYPMSVRDHRHETIHRTSLPQHLSRPREGMAVGNPGALRHDFANLNPDIYQKGRNEIDVPSRSIAVNPDYPINRIFRLGASRQMLENWGVSNTHAECAACDGQAKSMPSFSVINWNFDQDRSYPTDPPRSKSSTSNTTVSFPRAHPFFDESNVK
ncbi:hypothetical protein GFK91_31635 (plasmid) [Roseibium aggregatum]|uniref:hypothetical protein n=1 Tax=Roseibium aggregatum TaxID=187304 RepID=UPI001E359550|nr:hypothetical protein [Roseibium aggregatum]UES60266.1 hypothetical protein GFK91_31635 [Roseibium aggregatum]